MRHRMHINLEIAHEYVESLRGVFLADSISYDDFTAASKDARLAEVLAELDVQLVDADRLVFHLTACSTKLVTLGTFVRGAIMLNDAASKIDTLENQVNVNLARRKIDDLHRRQRRGKDEAVLHSQFGKMPLHVIKVSQTSIAGRLEQLCKNMTFSKERDRTTFTTTVHSVYRVMLSLSGGCGFVVAPQSGFVSVTDRNVDFQVVDRSDKFPAGYMTERLRDVPVHSKEFLEAMQEFTLHSDTDRWPDDHEASSLPKDGFTLVNGLSALRLKCAARMVGLPLPPFKWDNVGTRHLAALAACWAFRFSPSIVMVRSDGGKVHVLHAFDESHGITAWEIVFDDVDELSFKEA